MLGLVSRVMTTPPAVTTRVPNSTVETRDEVMTCHARDLGFGSNAVLENRRHRGADLIAAGWRPGSFVCVKVFDAPTATAKDVPSTRDLDKARIGENVVTAVQQIAEQLAARAGPATYALNRRENCASAVSQQRRHGAKLSYSAT